MSNFVTILNTTDRITKLFELPEEEQRYRYYKRKVQKTSSFINYRKDEDNNKLYYSETEYVTKFGKKLYLKVKTRIGFTFDYNANKLKLWFGVPIEKISRLENLFLGLNKEWVINEKFLSGKWISKSILEKILANKITNPTDCCKAILKSLKFKGSPELFRVYIKSGKNKVQFLHLAYVSKNVDNIFQYHPHKEFIHNDDLINQAQLLNKKIDWSWSKKRLESEHEKYTSELMFFESKFIKDVQLEYDSLPNLPEGWKILTTLKEVFMEGSIMKHCIYTNYWTSISNYKYVVIHLDYNDLPITIGLNVLNNYYNNENRPALKIDQHYSKRNALLTEEVKNYIKSILTEEKLEEIKLCLGLNENKIPKLQLGGIDEDYTFINDGLIEI